MTNDIRDRMGSFKLTRGSLVIAVERWLKDLAVDYAKMDEVSRHKEAEIYVDEFLATLSSPCACGGKTPLTVVEGWCRRRDTKWDGLGEWLLVLEEEQTEESPESVRVIVLPGGKP